MRIMPKGDVEYEPMNVSVEDYQDCETHEHLVEVLIEDAEETACMNTSIPEHSVDELWAKIQERHKA